MAVPLQGAAARCVDLCALEPGCWCHCRVPPEMREVSLAVCAFEPGCWRCWRALQSAAAVCCPQIFLQLGVHAGVKDAGHSVWPRPSTLCTRVAFLWRILSSSCFAVLLLSSSCPRATLPSPLSFSWGCQFITTNNQLEKRSPLSILYVQ